MKYYVVFKDELYNIYLFKHIFNKNCFIAYKSIKIKNG